MLQKCVVYVNIRLMYLGLENNPALILLSYAISCLNQKCEYYIRYILIIHSSVLERRFIFDGWKNLFILGLTAQTEHN